MAKVKLVNRQDLQVGDIVATRVEDSAGRLLINSGTEITDKHLRALAMWGIDQVAIPMGDDDIAEQEPLLSVEERELGRNAILPMFCNCNLDAAFMAALFAACIERKAFAMLRQRT